VSSVAELLQTRPVGGTYLETFDTDLGQWNEWPSAPTLTGGYADLYYDSMRGTFDLSTGASIAVEVTDVDYFNFWIEGPSGDLGSFSVDGGLGSVSYECLGVGGASATYSSTDHRWLRFYYDSVSSKLSLQVGPDGVAWTTLVEKVSPVLKLVPCQMSSSTGARVQTAVVTATPVGVPIGIGDWRAAVEILLPQDPTSRWGIAKWGESKWNGLAWYDLTPWVRGAEWTRGTEEFGGRPEVGVATVTLDNGDRHFSPWNGVSSFQDSTVTTTTGAVLPSYLGPGTLMRIVAYSPAGQIYPLTGPTSGVLSGWDFTGSSYAPSATDDNVSGSSITNGSLTSLVLNTSSYATPLLQANAGISTIAQSKTNNRYFEFTVTPEDTEMTLAALKMKAARSGGSGTRGCAVTSSLDGHTDYIYGPTNVTTTRTTLTQLNIDLTGGTFDNLTSPVTFRVYIYSTVNGGLDVDDIEVVGSTVGPLFPDADNSWVPQITGIVESWEDDTFGAGADGIVTVTFVETLAAMAKVDENARALEGLNDLPAARIQRLLDAADWQYGSVIDSLTEKIASSNYQLQSTDMANTRISELYLTADSVHAVVRSDRSGLPLIYNADGDDGLGYSIRRGPEAGRFDVLSWEYQDGYFGDLFTVAYVVDSLSTDNDDEVIENDIRMTYVGGSERSGMDNVSRQQHGRRTYSRADLICKTNSMVDYIIEKRLESRARRTLRLSKVQLHSAHERALIPIIGLDVGVSVNVTMPPLPNTLISVETAYVQGMTHRLTPLHGSGVVWTCDLTFGIQGDIFIYEI
jgi:hypothetical protein